MAVGHKTMKKQVLLAFLVSLIITPAVYALTFSATTEEMKELIGTDLGGIYNPVSLTPTSGDLTVTGNLAVTGTSNLTGEITTKVFNEVRYADQYAGSDIGAKANAAYLALSSIGGEIVISTSSSFSTPMDFSTANKTVLLRCLEGVTLTYTGVGTSTYFDLNKAHTTYGWGIEGCNFVGPGATGTTTGISVGGTKGGEGFTMRNTDITKFGLGMAVGDNTWMFSVDKSAFHWNGKEFTSYCATNCGEQWTFNDTVFFDTQDASGYNATSSVETGGNIASISFNDCSFDDAGVVVGAGTTAAFNDSHFEDPAGDAVPYYHYLTINDSIFTNVKIDGGYFLRTSTSTGASNRFIQNGGNLTLIAPMFDKASGATAINRAINNVGSFGTSRIIGGTSKNSALTSWINGVAPLAGADTQTIDIVTAKLASWPMAINQTGGNLTQITNGGAIRMTIDSSGNMGIGTTVPETLLHLNASGSIRNRTETDGGAHVDIITTATQGYVGTQSNHPFNIRTNDGDRITVGTTGLIGIGTTTNLSAQMQVTTPSANATTTIEVGKSGQNKGSCEVLYDVTGTVLYRSYTGVTPIISTTSCR